MGTILLIILILLLIGAAAGLALQFRVGLLAKWGIGLDSFDCNHPRLHGTPLKDRRFDRRELA